MTSQLVTLNTPGLKWWLDHLDEKFDPDVSVDLFIGALKRRAIQTPGPAAIGTVQLFLRLIYAHPFSSIREMVEHISSVGSDLSSARPLEFSVRNMARRVIGIIREEAENNGMGDLFLAALGAEDIPDLDLPKAIGRISLLSSHSSFVNPSDSVTGVFEILSVASSSRGSSAASSPPQTGLDRESQLKAVQRDIRPAVIQDIQELLDELDSCEQNISELAPQVIHKNEVIMTYGLPPVIHKFLLRASHKRDFTVVVVTGSANIRRQANAALMNRSTSKKEEGDDEQELAATKTLQERGIPLIAISENDTWNFMARVNKVLLAADYVFADGSLLAAAGTMGVVRAARKHYKMIHVVAGTHTLCPLTSFDNGDLVEMGAPVSVDYSQGAFIEHALLMNPLTDFIPPETVNSFITNNGLIAPNGLHRAILDMYHIPGCDLF